MKAILQRVSWAKVEIPDTHGKLRLHSEIGPGFLILLGIAPTDTEAQAHALFRKIISLRVFEDAQGKMNLSIQDIGGSNLIVSQFTLYADTRKGNRPSFIEAARPEHAQPLYEKCLAISNDLGIPTKSGIFGADMKVSLLNDGPVTLSLEQV